MVGNLEILSNQNSEELQELNAPTGELHLKFTLASGRELAFAAEGIAEVMSVSPEQIAPMPNISPLLLGVLNFRGKVIWVADLGQFLGEGTPLSTERTDIPILTLTDRQDLVLGIAIESVLGMEWLDSEALQPNPHCPNEMLPFIKGGWQLDEEKILNLLDHDAIIRSSRWAT